MNQPESDSQEPLRTAEDEGAMLVDYDTRRRDRSIALIMAMGLVGGWAYSMYAKWSNPLAEPYPALIMPGFVGTNGLKGETYSSHYLVVRASLDGDQTIEIPLTELILLGGQAKGFNAVTQRMVKLVNGPDGPTDIKWVSPQLWGLMEGAMDVQAADIKTLAVVLYGVQCSVRDETIAPQRRERAKRIVTPPAGNELVAGLQ